MSANKSKPHVLVLPEDDANRQIAVGFSFGVDERLSRQFEILAVAGGWIKVRESFEQDYIQRMANTPHASMVLLIDLDNQVRRIDEVKSKIPGNLVDRVFVLGCLDEPEKLKQDLGPYETIGEKLAKDCREGTEESWAHRLLSHNADELIRLRQHVRPILFS